jgi:putative DNA primase/helicase
MTALRDYARALGGRVSGHKVRFPAPGHSKRDSSCTLWISPASPVGFRVDSFTEDWRAVQDHVCRVMGICADAVPNPRPIQPARFTPVDYDTTPAALRLWSEGRDPRGGLVEKYLNLRRLDLLDDVAGESLRFHPECPWREDDGTLAFVPAMVALYRHVFTDEPVGIQRTRLTSEGVKVDRRMLGACGNGAIKLDADPDVTTGLTIGEGAETVLTARQIGLCPAWALGSSGAIGKFPVLTAIEALTILAETGETSARDVEACASRWHAAGREVGIIEPRAGSDLNDAIQELA